MTATTDDPRPRRSPLPSRARGATTELVREVCPYLEAAAGGWRSVQPTREHRCTATSPASPLALSKQRELCLQPTHLGCATYQAARGITADARASADGGLWPETRGAVLSLEPARSGRTGIPGLAGRGTGQAVLVALMFLAFLVLAIARISPPVSDGPSASSDAGAVASAAPGGPNGSPRAAPATPSATAEAPSSSTVPSSGVPSSVAPSASVPAVPSASPGGTTYRVKRGDTLSGIAAQYGTTVAALKAANGISDAGAIHPGQVLVIPG